MTDSKTKILVIEDEPPLRELYTELLSDEGYQVDSAIDGQIGIDKIKQGGWDLILLDIILPKMDGMTILQTLKNDPPKQKNGPIILLTALAQDTLVHKGLKLGAIGYLVKSEITPDQVLEQVKSFLQNTSP